MVSVEGNNEPTPLTPVEAGPSNPQFVPQTSMHSTLVSDDERTVINNQKVLRRDLKRPSEGEFNPDTVLGLSINGEMHRQLDWLRLH